MHLKIEGSGKPLTVLLTPGQEHEAPVFPQLLAVGAIHRAGRGRPRVRPTRIVGDKGYSNRAIRALCRRRGIRHTIPHRRDEHRAGPFDRAVYRPRYKVENAFARAKQFRALATRCDKRAASYRAFWVIAMTRIWLQDAL